MLRKRILKSDYISRFVDEKGFVKDELGFYKIIFRNISFSDFPYKNEYMAKIKKEVYKIINKKNEKSIARERKLKLARKEEELAKKEKEEIKEIGKNIKNVYFEEDERATFKPISIKKGMEYLEKKYGIGVCKKDFFNVMRCEICKDSIDQAVEVGVFSLEKRNRPPINLKGNKYLEQITITTKKNGKKIVETGYSSYYLARIERRSLNYMNEV